MVEDAVRRVAEVDVELLKLSKTRKPHMKPRAHEEAPWWWRNGEDAGDEDGDASRQS